MIPLPYILAFTPFFLGTFATLLFGRRPHYQSMPGLLFHSVIPAPGIEMAHFPEERFKKLCLRLHENQYNLVTLNEASKNYAVSRTDKKRTALITFDDGLQSVYRYALPILDHYGFHTTIFCIAGFFGEKSSWDVFSHNRHLTREEIRRVGQGIHEIGSHTCTHAYLPYLDEKSIIRELSDSKKNLEDIIGKEVTSLSFPYGGWNRRIWEIAKETGYTAATLYRGHFQASRGLFPVQGVHQFDSVDDILWKLASVKPLSPLRARTRMMAHFARGTPIWKFRKEYITVQG